ncbi:hypothetical protein KP509_13G085600 [Ceratopteris richardii]|uniref:glucan endo-1,3-beta-D-glucosidase n=1 Tax=Ceratopteris richardii TaxID=49495 RepID=A0A8T2TJK1_CERRI|nr:hypothetical protein KP509_13G085600 [Ceratopteris richardii]
MIGPSTSINSDLPCSYRVMYEWSFIASQYSQLSDHQSTRSTAMWAFCKVALSCALLACCAIACLSVAEARYKIGVDYGQLGNNLPSPTHAVALIKSLHIGHVKIYDANPAILRALSGTKITVTVMVTDAEVPQLAVSQKVADLWVKNNVSAYFPQTRIRTILVGNELLSDINQKQTWTQIVPAMRNLRRALIRNGRLHHKIKVSTPLALDMLEGSAVLPPSNATFRDDVRETVMRPMLRFLYKTRAPLFVDAYSYFEWANNAADVPLGMALFEESERGAYLDNGSGLRYDNLLDIQLDAVIAAMEDVGYGGVKLTLSETGWPTAEGRDERGGNIHNAALYNRRLVRKMLAHPAIGTPRRPGRHIPTFIFALFNENEKPGPVTERNWGLLYPNGTRVYEVDLTGKEPDASYPPLPPAPIEPAPGSQRFWCVANSSASISDLEGGIQYACAQAENLCAPLQEGQPCFEPNTTLSHASFAFNAYYVKFKAVGGSCAFGGAAVLTTEDPSYASCKYSPLIF